MRVGIAEGTIRDAIVWCFFSEKLKLKYTQETNELNVPKENQQEYSKILDSIQSKKNFVMMTGLMPSGKFHLGHAIIAQQMSFYQNLGAKLYIAVADLEAYTARQKNLSELREVAIDQYLKNYIALGLKPKNCDFYFQSERSKNYKKANAYYRLASNFSRHATFNEFKGV